MTLIVRDQFQEAYGNVYRAITRAEYCRNTHCAQLFDVARRDNAADHHGRRVWVMTQRRHQLCEQFVVGGGETGDTE